MICVTVRRVAQLVVQHAVPQLETVVAAVYARISSDPNDTSLGVARQVKDCQELSRRMGWRVGETFIDNDVSASNGRPRPQYQAMMQALSCGELGALVVWDVDRLTRTPRELEDVVDLGRLDRLDEQVAEAGGRVYLTKDARLRPDVLAAMYPALKRWRAIQAQLDPGGVLRSDLSRRLGLLPPSQKAARGH